ncbi:MAG: CocE/NonD family hydrolase [Pirellulales bacterium]
MHRLLYLVAILVSFSCSPLSAEVTLTNDRVAMRDGVRLATDIYRDPAIDKAPVVLMRTPYNKQRNKAAAEKFAAAGYIAVVQDCRGKFESEGDFIPYNNEGQDGYDCIEWIGRQNWCNGRIGVCGAVHMSARRNGDRRQSLPAGLVTILRPRRGAVSTTAYCLGGACRHVDCHGQQAIHKAQKCCRDTGLASAC